MRIKAYSLRPYFDLDNVFMNIPGAPTFDPKHPGTYPGAEVEIVEVLSPDEALVKYGKEALCKGAVLYSPSYPDGIARGNPVITIWRNTGRTSRQVVYGTSDWAG